MARFEFKMPDVGEGLAEVEISKWKVSVGDQVVENQDIADIETDKSVVSMPAPATGTIVSLEAEEGERIAVGALLMVVEVASADESTETDAEPASAPRGDEPPERPSSRRPAGRVAAAPSARRLAREMGVALEEVVGSGPRGRITPEDVRAHVERDGEADPVGASEDGAGAKVEEVPLRGIRRRVAENLTASYRDIPHVAGFHEFVVPRLVAEYERCRSSPDGAQVTYLAFVVRATALALVRNPWLNAELDDDRGRVLLRRHYDIGIAIASPEGLVVPVVRNADQLDLHSIAAELQRLARAAEAASLRPEDQGAGTFTISNVGPAGGNYGTSLIRPPEVAILGLGRITDRAVVEEGAVVARPVLPVSLTFDHRVVDGAQALAFVADLRSFLEENPGSLVAPAGDEKE